MSRTGEMRSRRGKGDAGGEEKEAKKLVLRASDTDGKRRRLERKRDERAHCVGEAKGRENKGRKHSMTKAKKKSERGLWAQIRKIL